MGPTPQSVLLPATHPHASCDADLLGESGSGRGCVDRSEPSGFVWRDEEVRSEAVGLVLQQVVVGVAVDEGLLLGVMEDVCGLMEESEPEEVVLLVAVTQRD